MKRFIIVYFILFISLLFGCTSSDDYSFKYKIDIGMSKQEIQNILVDYNITYSDTNTTVYEVANDNIDIYVKYNEANQATDIDIKKIANETTIGEYEETETNLNINNIAFPIPQEIDTVLNYSFNTISFICKNHAAVSEYYESLIDKGWVLIKPKTNTSPYSTYVNDEEGLLIGYQENQHGGIEMNIKHYQGTSQNKSVKDFDTIIENSVSYEKIYHIIEFDISQATKALELYGFYVFTEMLEPTKLVVDKYDNITKINYDQYAVYDIDQDGEDEFITKLGYGHGRYIITFSVFKYDEKKKELILANRTLYEQLEEVDMFLNENNGMLEIVAGALENSGLENMQSYGELLILDGVLTPTKQDIPFKLLND